MLSEENIHLLASLIRIVFAVVAFWTLFNFIFATEAFIKSWHDKKNLRYALKKTSYVLIGVFIPITFPNHIPGM